MSLEYGREEGSCFVRLAGVADLSIAAELKAALLEVFTPVPSMVTVDLAGVSELNITVLQLIWAAAREAQACHAGFRLQRPQDGEVVNALIDIGVTLPSNRAPEISQEPTA